MQLTYEGYERDYTFVGKLKCRLGFHLLNPVICVRCGWIVPHARPIYSEGHENLENMMESSVKDDY